MTFSQRKVNMTPLVLQNPSGIECQLGMGLWKGNLVQESI